MSRPCGSARPSKNPRSQPVSLSTTLTDPGVRTIKPGTVLSHILDGDGSQVMSCWKCLTIIGMAEAIGGAPADALVQLKDAITVVRHETESVPWLISRVELITADVAMGDQ